MTNQANNLGQTIIAALIQFLKMLVFVLFLCPFNFWRKAAERLETASKEWSWTELKSTSKWPFLSFLKAVLFGFIFDGLIFISYFVGVLYGFYKFIDVWSNAAFEYGFTAFISTIITAYYMPMIISPIRDLLYIAIMPFAKFLSWCARPAQYLEIDMKNK